MAASIFSIAQKLALMISNEYDFLSDVPDQAQSLCKEISLMTSALQDASEKHRTRNEVKEWLNQVRDVVMDAEDVIDFFIYVAQRQRHRNILTRYTICYPNQLYHLHQLGKKMENSIKKMSQLSVRRSTLGLAISEEGESSVGSMISNELDQLPFRRRRGDLVQEFSIIGFEKEEGDIVQKLLIPIESPRPSPSVVSIVGMGGSGKTTLARKIYKRNDVKSHFQICAWISVSQQYSIKDLLHVIMEQIKPLTPEEKKELNVESLMHRLSSQLKETTYLIVFDDLWRPKDWNLLKQALPVQGDDFQSRVLVTTRNEIVARCADPSVTPFFLRLLDEDESWKLFLTKLMIGCPEDLEDLGRQIIHKCHGLPLAIVVLGGLLSIKPRTHNAWSKVLDSVNWELNQNERNCKQVLALSYTELPDHLKPCFLYLGLFPEDYEIWRNKLIWLWVAEGFVQPRGHLTMEDVAEDYLEELIQRSLIQAPVRLYDDRVTYFRIHDLIRDLAISEAKQERFLEVLGSADHSLISTNKSRRLSLIEHTGGMRGSPAAALNQGTTPNNLRSLFCLHSKGNMEMIKKSSYGAMKLLRVLDLQGVKSISNSLLKQIGKLILLTYLNLRGTNIKELPSSIGDLRNLQTLNLRYTRLRQLPNTIMKLKQLRNLVFSSSPHDGIQSFDYPLDQMMDLQILMLNEGKWIDSSLEKLTNLRALSIDSSGSMSPYKEVLLNALPRLNHLRCLQLKDWTRIGGNEAVVLPVSFSGHLELHHMDLLGISGILDFPPNLTTLSFNSPGGQGIEELMVNLKKLPKLRCLDLTSVDDLGSNVIFSADGFRQLEELVLMYLGFTVEEGALPNLRVLNIIGSDELKRLPCGLKQVVTLQELTLGLMSDELQDRVRKDAGEDWDIIKHIPSIKIDESKHGFILPNACQYDIDSWC
ncbi:putative disease resistance protein At1g50180 isoform X1 [Macadamia integrifolia]|uniref:putative disease resistance protein At1g50180 isoform X1 n=1 Tax=Macadamia integrifolia TaxID=60698 RepID=UPI001C531C95|nr:putative disease resistance protein At1g50180 isoform X1 [Macadamia integrifolia]